MDNIVSVGNREYNHKEEIHSPNLLIGKKNDFHKPVPFDEICFIESCLGKVKIISMSDTYTCRHNLAYLEEILPNNIFYRCHRAFIVNVYKIDRIITKSKEPMTLCMKDKNHSKIVVSQNITREFRNFLKF